MWCKNTTVAEYRDAETLLNGCRNWRRLQCSTNAKILLAMGLQSRRLYPRKGDSYILLVVYSWQLLTQYIETACHCSRPTRIDICYCACWGASRTGKQREHSCGRSMKWLILLCHCRCARTGSTFRQVSHTGLVLQHVFTVLGIVPVQTWCGKFRKFPTCSTPVHAVLFYRGFRLYMHE